MLTCRVYLEPTPSPPGPPAGYRLVGCRAEFAGGKRLTLGAPTVADALERVAAELSPSFVLALIAEPFQSQVMTNQPAMICRSVPGGWGAWVRF